MKPAALPRTMPWVLASTLFACATPLPTTQRIVRVHSGPNPEASVTACRVHLQWPITELLGACGQPLAIVPRNGFPGQICLVYVNEPAKGPPLQEVYVCLHETGYMSARAEDLGPWEPYRQYRVTDVFGVGSDPSRATALLEKRAAAPPFSRAAETAHETGPQTLQSGAPAQTADEHR